MATRNSYILHTRWSSSRSSGYSNYHDNSKVSQKGRGYLISILLSGNVVVFNKQELNVDHREIKAI